MRHSPGHWLSKKIPPDAGGACLHVGSKEHVQQHRILGSARPHHASQLHVRNAQLRWPQRTERSGRGRDPQQRVHCAQKEQQQRQRPRRHIEQVRQLRPQRRQRRRRPCQPGARAPPHNCQPVTGRVRCGAFPP
eukprot:353088-Chlamydomonas_euryale.AAC.18